MSSPTEQFSSLSIHSPMSPQSRRSEVRRQELETRKYEVRDILSSFEPSSLPAEIRPNVFQSIDEEQGRRNPSEWTVPGDLQGTLMTWASHNNDVLRVLRGFQTPEQMTILFWEKLPRRIKAEFESYAKLTEDAGPETKEIAERIANNFRNLEEAFMIGRRERPIPEGVLSKPETVYKSYIGALAAVCDSYEDLTSADRSTRSSGGRQRAVSLYHLLIVNPPVGVEPFMIVLLEQLAFHQPQLLSGFRRELEHILGLLETLHAPSDYRDRLARILQRLPLPKHGGDDDDDDKNDGNGNGNENDGGRDPGKSRSGKTGHPAGKKRPADEAPGRTGKRKAVK
jgi:hypothetical protein